MKKNATKHASPRMPGRPRPGWISSMKTSTKPATISSGVNMSITSSTRAAMEG